MMNRRILSPLIVLGAMVAFLPVACKSRSTASKTLQGQEQCPAPSADDFALQEGGQPEVEGAGFHSDPKVSGYIKAALKYVGRLADVELNRLEKMPLGIGVNKLQTVTDNLLRRQGAESPLVYPLPPRIDSEKRKEIYSKNPNEDLFLKLPLSKFTPSLRKVMDPLVVQMRQERQRSGVPLADLSAVEVSDLLQRVALSTTLEKKDLENLQDILGAYIIRFYNDLGSKAGHCHGAARPLPEGPN